MTDYDNDSNEIVPSEPSTSLKPMEERSLEKLSGSLVSARPSGIIPNFFQRAVARSNEALWEAKADLFDAQTSAFISLERALDSELDAKKALVRTRHADKALSNYEQQYLQELESEELVDRHSHSYDIADTERLAKKAAQKVELDTLRDTVEYMEEKNRLEARRHQAKRGKKGAKRPPIEQKKVEEKPLTLLDISRMESEAIEKFNNEIEAEMARIDSSVKPDQQELERSKLERIEQLGMQDIRQTYQDMASNLRSV